MIIIKQKELLETTQILVFDKNISNHTTLCK